MAERVLVGMSGGIDSTVTALLLQEQGYEPFGVTLVLQQADALPVGACGYDASREAAEVARQIGIPHEVIDARTAFTSEVLEASWRVFASGGTPNPCVFCNAHVRFAIMVAAAKARGVSLIATGHYAQIVRAGDVYRLARGADHQKDQSYFLHGVSSELYPHILFPLGKMTKPEVREKARQFGLMNAEKSDSQDLCFSGPEGHFSEKLRKMFSGASVPGVFVDESGRVLGHHTGIHQYTLGQRKGLGFATGSRVKICKIDSQNGTICVSPRSDAVMGRVAVSHSFHWAGKPLEVGTQVLAQVRYRQTAMPASITKADGKNIEILFNEPVFSITKGQSLVLYDGPYVLGGGEISASSTLADEALLFSGK